MERRISRWLLFIVACIAITVLVFQIDNRWLNRSLAGYITRLEVELHYVCFRQKWSSCSLILKKAEPYDLDSSTLLSSGHTLSNRLIEFHSGICSGNANKVKRPKQQNIYHWTDNVGTEHFSDRRDAMSAAQTNYQSPTYNFDLSIHALSSGIKPFFKDRLSAYLRQVDGIYRTLLPPEELLPVRVDVTLIQSKAVYDDIFMRYYTLNVNSQGFYSHRDNLAVVWYRTDTQGFATAVHESVHVMNAAQFGITPRWFNEGMAEYFENMDLDGFNVTIQPGDWSLVRHSPMQLINLFNATDGDWAQNQTLFYQYSHALMYFLMSQSEGKNALKDLFSAVVHFRCKPIDMVQTLNASYPGGLAALEQQWRRWLASRPKNVVVS
ncbi:hypothetical protein KDN34_11110 [Shewanella yunxiaonensis]|uniref:DUF1570 domain-containing protein n=1 Tax=Shewanella yunxiaonensis TaxID=2829809 RepID=A0ABX7YPV4_9GAMM|nr:hypothetical protein [Shewanella yunxiaonensis]QUN04798.1 hypothetical protein KDN34_11110 [Shewanella yunxiaonensis]